MAPVDLTKADILAAFGMPPKDAIAYLEGKGLRFGWNWQDTRDQAKTIHQPTAATGYQLSDEVMKKNLRSGRFTRVR